MHRTAGEHKAREWIFLTTEKEKKEMEKELKVKVEGIVPIIFHNGQLKDPLNSFVREIKKFSKKANKTDEDHLEISRLEFLGGAYLNAGGQPIIPATGIERALAEAGKRIKIGKAGLTRDIKAGLFVQEDAILDFEDKGKTMDELWELGEKYVLRNAVNVQKNSVMRTRPIFREWGAVFKLSYFDDVLDSSSIEQALTVLSRLVGLYEWRPRYGRFTFTIK
jgi:hypothetical protein